jgi:DNA (cytosine-5)-methyltransferase 1
MMAAHSPRAGLCATTAARRNGCAATPCCVAPGRATPNGAPSQATVVSPDTGRSAQLRVLDIFAGIGGFSYGLERTGGFKTVQFCEIDPFCRRVLAKHWPDVPCHDDVTTMQFHEGMADVVTGGFPCQDISFAGKGAGLAGERSGLYRHLVDAIRVVRPRYAILENVAALLSRGLGDVLGDLAAIGYDAECHCIPASAVGAPHRRDRIWIVANARGQQHQGGGPAFRRSIAAELPRAHPHPAPLQWPLFLGHEQDRDHAGAGEVADAVSSGLQGAGHVQGADSRGQEAGQPLVSGEGIGRQWRVEPAICRVAHGVPQRVDRLRALGNSIVPQIATLIGEAILTADHRVAA